MPIKRINLLKIYWLRCVNKKAIKYAISLNRLRSYFTITNPNV